MTTNNEAIQADGLDTCQHNGGMHGLRLVRPGAAYVDAIWDYRTESLADAPHMNGACDLEDIDDPCAWIAHCQALADPATVPEGHVQAEEWLLMRGDDPRILGMVNLRAQLDEYMSEYAGHIGYSVRPSERGRGLGRTQLLLALGRCREIGLDRVLITCEEDNVASQRTAESCGAVFERATFDESDGVMMRRYWVRL